MYTHLPPFIISPSFAKTLLYFSCIVVFILNCLFLPVKGLACAELFLNFVGLYGGGFTTRNGTSMTLCVRACVCVSCTDGLCCFSVVLLSSVPWNSQFLSICCTILIVWVRVCVCCDYTYPFVHVSCWLWSLLSWHLSIFMVTLCILYNPVSAPTTPSVCGKCFSSTFTAALVSNQTLFLCPSFSSCLYLLSPLWHLISFWVGLPPNILFIFLFLSVSPFFFHYVQIHPHLLLFFPPPSSLPPGFICDPNFGVFCGSVCVFSVLIQQRRRGKQRGSTLSVCTLSFLSRLSLSLYLFLLSLSHTLETHDLICHVSTSCPIMAGSYLKFIRTVFLFGMTKSDASPASNPIPTSVTTLRTQWLGIGLNSARPLLFSVAMPLCLVLSLLFSLSAAAALLPPWPHSCVLVYTDVVNVSPSASKCPLTPAYLHAWNLLKCI